MVLASYHDGEWLFELSMDANSPDNIVKVHKSKPWKDEKPLEVATGRMCCFVKSATDYKLGIDWTNWTKGEYDVGTVLGNLSSRACALSEQYCKKVNL